MPSFRAGGLGRAGYVVNIAGQKIWRATPHCGRLSNVRSNNLASRPVSRVLYGLGLAPQTWRPFILGRRCRLPRATYPDTHSRKGLPRFPLARCPYSVLLPAGLAMPLALPPARWALTPPFHPCRAVTRGRRRAVRSLWRFPWGRPRRPLTGAVFPWSPDFPHCPPFGRWTMRPPGRLAPPLNGVINEKARKSFSRAYGL